MAGETRWHRLPLARVISSLLVMLVASLLLAPAVPALAKTDPASVTMKDGESYNISDYTQATMLVCDAEGTYYLSGTSSNTILDIKVPSGQTATFYLNNMSMTPSEAALGGSDDKASAILVEETGGTVNLCTLPEVTATFSSKGSAPAIRKDGRSTKLVFSTRNPNDPGTLVARASEGATRTCGIGGGKHYTHLDDHVTGNMTFESGNVEAYGSHGYNSITTGTGGPGIGASWGGNVDGLTFCGANVKAVAGDLSAAGIGTTTGSAVVMTLTTTVNHITISGGTVDASHYIKQESDWAEIYGGAGIGGGNAGSLDNLTITGGTVNASGSTGIGGGSNGDGHNIKISGGNVNAHGVTCGIGGGMTESGLDSYFTCDGPDDFMDPTEGESGLGSSSSPKSSSDGSAQSGGKYVFGNCYVYISGGTVNAETVSLQQNQDGVGIGSWHCTDDPSGEVVIVGGNVTAEGSGQGAGIGCGRFGSLKRICIAGGTVSATGGKDACGIGRMLKIRGDTSDITPCDCVVKLIEITGGTVTATGGSGVSHDIGAYKTCKFLKWDRTLVKITGGNVRTAHGADGVFGDPKTGDSKDAVYLAKIRLENFDEPIVNPGEAVSKLNILNGSDTYEYNTNDMKVFQDDTELWVWLPAGATVSEADLADDYVAGASVFNGCVESKKKGVDDGVLYPAITADLNVSTSGTLPWDAHNGTAQLKWGDTKATKLEDAVWPHHVVTGYYLNDPASELMEPGGTLEPNVSGYTSADGKFTGLTKEAFKNHLQLYAKWDDCKYNIRFDANKPRNASHDVSGTMAGQSTSYDTQVELATNAYSLKGWIFRGWNTKADGSGMSFSDRSTVVRLTDEDGATVVLYAQWEPWEYYVSFSAGNGTGTMGSVMMSYDQTSTLPSCGFTNPGHTFRGWMPYGRVGNYYADCAKVVNLCTFDRDGVPQGLALVAKWAASGCVTVMVTNNDVPVEHLSDALSLENQQGTKYGIFVDAGEPGLYTAPNVPAGTYRVLLSGYDTTDRTVEVDDSSTGQATLAYCTVSIESDPHGTSWAKSKGTTQVDNVLVSSNLDIGTDVEADSGYSFGYYTSSLCRPTWEGWDQTTRNQSIQVNGQTIIQAHLDPIKYQVSFDANGGEGNAKAQNMTYDEPQNLFANTFTRVGYDFAGWNTVPDGSGTPYDDGASVENLAATDGATVKLYAQWTPHGYFVNYLPNGGSGLMADQKIYYDDETTLKANEYTREGCHFTGWNTAADGSGTAYADGASVKNLASDDGASVTLYAQWEHDVYTVVYDPNDGSGQPWSEDVWVESQFLAPFCSYYRTGLGFTSWNTMADGSGTTYAPGSIISPLSAGETMTLYAQWRPYVYTIDFDANAGSTGGSATGSMNAQTIDYGDSATLAPNEFAIAGYTFAGWNTASDGSGTSYADGTEVVSKVENGDETITLYAQWTSNGGPVNPANPVNPDGGSGTEGAGAVPVTGDGSSPAFVLALSVFGCMSVLVGLRRHRKA
ncbi:MAG: InlB B-repeat-containing protein [Atopobiaceae bacterium]|nr:InlB B-repeat-containing protein [Atopobiaceae bacterium]